jgi:hypothetical protein
MQMMSPLAYLHNPANCIATKFVHTSTNIQRCPINVVTVRTARHARDRLTLHSGRLRAGD